MVVSQDQHQRTPRLEDFFWTGSGDGPPPPPDAPLPAPVQPSTPVVRTTTVLATVYLDSYPPQVSHDYLVLSEHLISLVRTECKPT